MSARYYLPARRGLPALVLALLLMPVLCLTARAATLTVTSTADSGPGSLRAAINTANTDGGDDTIQFSLPANSVIRVGSTLTITAPMTIQGPGAAGLAIDGGYTGGSSGNGVGVFALSGGTAGQPVALSGLTIQHGVAGGGGGVGVASGTASLTDCVLTGNYALFGGCVYNQGAISLTRCTLANSTGTLEGGGFANGSGTATLTGCTFTNNVGSEGGGLANPSGCAVTVTDCTFSGNMCVGAPAADEGGGLYNTGQATLTGCVISGNSGEATVFGGPDEGDGLYNNGQATLTDCAIVGNSSQSGDGGGLDNDNAGTVTLVNCSLTNNSTQTDFAVVGGGPLGGGGVVNSGTAMLTGCVLSANGAALRGGALLNSGGTATLTGCTLAGNSAGTNEQPMFQGYAGGGAVYVGGGTVNLTDDILYGDSSPNGAEVQGAVAASHCDVQQSGFGQPGRPATPDVSGSFDADPLFVGGGDLHLRSGSPCAGAGTTTAPNNSYLPYDLDGRPRPTPGFANPSIGAYEAAPTGAYSLVVENASDSLPQSLRTAVQCADDYPNAAITFDPAVFTTLQTIPLTGGQLTLTQPMSITGPAPGVAVSGNGRSRVFEIGGGTASAPVALTGLTVEDGVAPGGGSGGGVEVDGGADAALTGCALTGNSADDGGGGLLNLGTATLTVCALTGNSAPGDDVSGGGLLNLGTALLTRCFVADNSASGGGGGLYNTGAATLTACALVGNSAEQGGGLFNDFGTATLTGCTLTGNSASGGGGGLFNLGTATLADDILYGDTGGEVFNLGASAPTATYSDIQGGYPGTGNVSVDPLFVNAPTDLHVRPGSPVIGAGIFEAVNAHDITGQARADPPTLGAYEGQKAQTRTSLASSLDPSAVGQSVTLTVTVTDAAPGGAVPTGTVTLSGLPGGDRTLTLSGGAASVTTNTLPAGAYTLTASYTPGPGFLASPAPPPLTQTVLGVPTANAQSVSVAFNTAKAVMLTGSDPNSPPRSLTYTVATQPLHGTLSGPAPRLTYTPNTGYHGTDSFTFTVSNGPGNSQPATVTLSVAAGVPTANAQSVTTSENAAKGITLTGTDPDSPPLTLTYAVGTQPAHGTLSGMAPNLTYTPTAGYSGPDSFTFTVSNGVNTSPPATVSLTVTQVAANVTGQVTVVRGGYRLVRASGHYLQPVTLTNNGAALSDPISLVLDGLTPSTVTLVGASGTTNSAAPTGSPYVTLPAGGLASGASVTVTLEFSAQPTGYTPRLLAGPGAR